MAMFHFAYPERIMDGSSAPISRTLRGLYGSRVRDAYIVIVRARIDETGTHGDPQSPVILSAVVASYLNWDRFDRKWTRLMKRAGVRYIRAKEIIGGSGAFQGVSREKRARAAESIDDAMNTHLKFGVVTVLWPADFAAYRDPTGSGLNSLLYSDYGVSFRVILSFLHGQADRLLGSDPEIYVVYETGHKNSGAAAVVFQEYARHYPSGAVKSVAPVLKQASYGTQAADIRGSLALQDERAGSPPISEYDTSDPDDVAKLFKTYKVPWFRFVIGAETLTQLRDEVILSRPKFTRLYGHLLSDPSLLDGPEKPHP